MDRIQRGFEPLQQTINHWHNVSLTDDETRVVIYEAFVEGKLKVSPKIMRSVHQHYFDPQYEEFRERSLWSLSNGFTNAFKELKPANQFQATARLGPFLNRYARPF